MSIKDLLQLAASGATGGMKQSGAGKGPFQHRRCRRRQTYRR
jgi:hypothetical protein